MRVVFVAICCLLMISQLSYAQENVLGKDGKNRRMKTVEAGKTMVGGYGEMIYTDVSGSTPANMEFYRFIFYLDHYFNNWIAFKSEMEYEHGTELTLEQAYIELAVSEKFAIRTGLVLVPTSRINLYHEPSYFLTVSRPKVESVITPTTWREFGAGVVYMFSNGISFEGYILAGLNSEGFNGTNSIRGGRQGAGSLKNGASSGAFRAVLREPAFATRVDYHTPLSGLKVGSALYYGSADNRTDGVKTNSNVTVFSLDADYQWQYLHLVGTFGLNAVSNADQVNLANGAGVNQGIGSKATGYSIAASYDLLPHLKSDSEQQLLPFIFYEKYNTHASVPNGTTRNPAYEISRTIIGLNYKPDYNVVFKMDYTFQKNAVNGADTFKYFQFGIGYNF